MTPAAYCQRKAGGVGSSTYYAFRFLPAERRRAVTALYAFGRELVELGDRSGDAAPARTSLAWWRTEIDRLRAGRAQHPVALALAPALTPYGLAAEHLIEIVDAVEPRLGHTRRADFASLERDCARLDGALATLAAGILGYRDARTRDYAEQLGIALRLTEVIRDVGGDARRDRLYLPLEDLERFGVPERDILAARTSDAFVELMRYEVRRTRAVYERAVAMLPTVDRRTQRPGLMLAAMQRALLAEIERGGFDVLRRRTSLTPMRKLGIAWKTWVRG